MKVNNFLNSEGVMDMTWNKYLTDLICQKKGLPKGTLIETYEKRKAEYSIILRLEALFGERTEIEKLSTKYYVKRGDEYNQYHSIFDIDNIIKIDRNSNDLIYSIFRIRQIFWKFIENTLSNLEKTLEMEYPQIYDFLYLMTDNSFKSIEDRIEYVKNFHKSYCKTFDKDELYVDIIHGIVPKRLESKIADIYNLCHHPLLMDLFGMFEVDIGFFQNNDFSQFTQLQIFESASEEERELYKLLYLEFPKTLPDCRGQYYDNFDVIRAMKTGQWEKFDMQLRKKLANCLDILYNEDRKTFYTFFKVNDAYELESKFNSLKTKIEEPFYYRIKKDIDFLQNFFGHLPKEIETKIKKAHIESFQVDLRKLIEKYFDTYNPSKHHSI